MSNAAMLRSAPTPSSGGSMADAVPGRARAVRVLRAEPAMGAAFTAADEARFLEVNPTATVVLIAGTSHAIHDEEPEHFTAELLSRSAP